MTGKVPAVHKGKTTEAACRSVEEECTTVGAVRKVVDIVEIVHRRTAMAVSTAVNNRTSMDRIAVDTGEVVGSMVADRTDK